MNAENPIPRQEISEREAAEAKHDAKVAELFGQVDALFRMREVPQHKTGGEYSGGGDRWQKLTLTDDELAVAGTIFEGNVMDAPTHIEITFMGNYKGTSAPKGSPREELLVIATESEGDVKSSYSMWYKPGSQKPVEVSKQVLRVSESPIPYVVTEGISTPTSVQVENISDTKHFEPYEQTALAELVEALKSETLPSE
jgi:hypothetical protein